MKTTFGGFDTILHHYEEYILVHKRNYFEIHVSGQILCDPSLNMFSKCLRPAGALAIICKKPNACDKTT